jgi:hypothetical protein
MNMLSRIMCAIFGHHVEWVCGTKMATIHECQRCGLFIAIPKPQLLLEIEMAKIDAAPYLKEMARKDVGLGGYKDTD